jgi:hypothetical protein
LRQFCPLSFRRAVLGRIKYRGYATGSIFIVYSSHFGLIVSILRGFVASITFA